jgi:hypothetical protein
MKTNTLLGIILIGAGVFAYQGITYMARLLWGLGLVSSYTMSESAHILLVIAIMVMLTSVIQVRTKLFSRWGRETWAKSIYG